MKRILLLFFVVGLGWSEGVSQAGMWTWMKGADTLNSQGSFGIKGLSASTNDPPARYACGSWTDIDGNFWIYGGNRRTIANGLFLGSDLWKFSPNTNEWIWMNGRDSPILRDTAKIMAAKGVFHPENTPGARGFGMFTWTTSNNYLWLYGGGTSYYPDNSIWKYDPSINQWAWMGGKLDFYPTYGVKGVGGSNNSPGDRSEGGASWVDDSSNLWFFGGFTNGYTFNDMWKYDINTMTWSWMSGSKNSPDTGVYGTLKVPSVNFYPSSRFSNLFWKDKEGYFWLIGGSDFENMYQDIWKFNPKTLEWTWVMGSKNSEPDKYGEYCNENPLNRFGGRFENRASWKVCDEIVVPIVAVGFHGIVFFILTIMIYGLSCPLARNG